MKLQMKKGIIEKYLRPRTPLATALRPGGALKERIRCILFDIYGTLLISVSGDIGPAVEKSTENEQLIELLERYGVRKSPEALLTGLQRAIEDRHRELRNQGVDFPEVRIERIWKKILPKDDDRTVRQFALEFELIVNPVYPMPNLTKMLSACRRRKIMMGIISNAQFYTPELFRWFLGANLKELGFDPELVFYSYRLQVAKPSPLLFEMAAEKLRLKGIPPSAVLYLGNDMLKDIYPAKSIGFQTALFAGDQRSLRLRLDDHRCQNLYADLMITDLDQLTRHIDHDLPEK